MEQKFMGFYLYFIADYRAWKNLRCPFNWWWFSADRDDTFNRKVVLLADTQQGVIYSNFLQILTGFDMSVD